jgi:rRNA maturation endonuclease Nob1
MKKFVAIMAGCLMLGGFSAMAEPSATDQKWLTAVQKMVEDGQTRVSTPSEERVKLLKEWAAKQGLAVQVTKTDAGFSIELQKKVAKN